MEENKIKIGGLIGSQFILRRDGSGILTVEDTEFDGKHLWIYFKEGFANIDDCFFFENLT